MQTPSLFAQFSLLRATSSMKSRPFASIPWATRRLARYARELSTFFKKRSETLPEECVARAKQDVFLAAELTILRERAEDLPAPTEHLSDASRKRFEDLLEYLEMTETPYELARTLISRGSVWNDTCFEISVGGRRVAWGSRYNDLARHFFPDAPFSATGAVFQIASEGRAVKRPHQRDFVSHSSISATKRSGSLSNLPKIFVRLASLCRRTSVLNRSPNSFISPSAAIAPISSSWGARRRWRAPPSCAIARHRKKPFFRSKASPNASRHSHRRNSLK